MAIPLAVAGLAAGAVGNIIGGSKAKKAADAYRKSAQETQDTLMAKAATMGAGDLSADNQGRSWMKKFDRQAQGYFGADPRQRYERGQSVAARQLMGQARGLLSGPSAAELQMAQGMQDAQRGVASGLASQRGLTPAMAAKLGAEQRAGIMSEGAAQGAILRAQEDAQRQQLAAQMRTQAAGIRAQMDAARRAQTGMDRQMGLGLMDRGFQRTAAEQQADMAAKMAQMNTIARQDQINQVGFDQAMQGANQWSAMGNEMMGLGLGMMAGGGGGLSGALAGAQGGGTQLPMVQQPTINDLTGTTMSDQLYYAGGGNLGGGQTAPAYGGFGLSAEQAGPQPGVYNPGTLTLGGS